MLISILTKYEIYVLFTLKIYSDLIEFFSLVCRIYVLLRWIFRLYFGSVSVFAVVLFYHEPTHNFRISYPPNNNFWHSRKKLFTFALCLSLIRWFCENENSLIKHKTCRNTNKIIINFPKHFPNELFALLIGERERGRVVGYFGNKFIEWTFCVCMRVGGTRRLQGGKRKF